FFSSRRRHTRWPRDWSSDVCSSDLIPDAHFLFHADFKRAGSDLILTGEDGHRVVVPGYFKHEHLPTLLAPNGGALTGDVVEALRSEERRVGKECRSRGSAYL